MALFSGFQRKLFTNAFLFDGSTVLLGRKLRGWREGIHNGFGGKLEPGETVVQAAMRELQEEADVVAKDLTRIGVFTQTFINKPETLLEIHVFTVHSWEGEPAVTDEMEPHWFAFDQIPFENMWKDDVVWFPFLLKKTPFVGHCHFDGDEVMLSHSYEEAPKELLDAWDATKPSEVLASHYQRCLDLAHS